MSRGREHLTKSLLIDADALDELSEEFPTLREENYIEKANLKRAFELLGFPLAGYELRNLEKEVAGESRISGEALMMLHAKVKEQKDVGRTFKPEKVTKEDVNLTKITSQSQDTSVHTVSRAEEEGFADWINQVLKKDPLCAGYLPIDIKKDGELYLKCADGIILCKLVNVSVPDTVDPRALNTGKALSSVFKRNENLTLAVNSAESIGCTVVNIGPEDIAAQKRHLVLGLIWQIIRIGLLSMVNVRYHPDIDVLLEEGETVDDLRQLSPEELLLRWVNYHLRQAGVQRKIQNFKEDIMDSEVYAHLLAQIAPEDKQEDLYPVSAVLHGTNHVARAEKVLANAEKLNARAFVQAEDIAKANERGKNRERLNLAFVANLFNNYPALTSQPHEVIEETMEEKTYRNWMNSMGVSPFVKDLYFDVRNGLVLLQLFDVLQPGSVNWTKVVRVFNPKKKIFQMQDNCSYVIQYMKEHNLKVVNLSGEDIRNGEKKLILGICFQLMSAYTQKMLSTVRGDGKPVDDKTIIAWANEKLREAGKSTSVTGFKDPSISTGRPIIDLIEAIKPQSINYEMITDDNESNCKFAISMARRAGARVYALPQHLVEVNPKMVMTVFACLMVLDYQLKLNPDN